MGCVQDIHGIAASTKYSQIEKVRDLCLSYFIPILPTGHIAIVNKSIIGTLIELFVVDLGMYSIVIFEIKKSPQLHYYIALPNISDHWDTCRTELLKLSAKL